MKTKILAVMFTDIAGYTQRTSKQTYEENAQLLKQHAAIVHPLIRKFGGQVIKEMGDAVLAVFCSPTRAVEAAMAVQDRLAEINGDREPEDQLHLRIAVNVGEVRIQGNDVFGEGVNVAARLETETPVDEIYISGATYLTMNRSNVPLKFLGQRELKGIAEPVTVFQLPRFAVLDDGESLMKTKRDAALPYGGRQLKHLANQRRRRRFQMAAVAAGLLGVLGLIGHWALGHWSEEVRRVDVVAAVDKHDWHRAATLLEELEADGIDTREPVAALFREIKHDNDPGRACRALEMFGQVFDDPGRREAVAQLRLHHGFGLMRVGELAQAQACFERIALAGSTPEARILELSDIHLDALQALRGRSIDELRDGLKRYEDFLRVGNAPEEHLALIAEIAADSYAFTKTRPVADSLVAGFVRAAAAPALAERAVASETPGIARNWIVARLEAVAADVPLDWTAIYTAQLDERSCSARRNAIEQIQKRGRLSAVGLLMRELAKSDRCTRDVARAAVNDLVENGDADLITSAPTSPLLVAAR